MLNDATSQYILTFKGFRGRKAAADLAFRASRSIGDNRRRAFKVAVKAFIGKKVYIRQKVINLTVNKGLKSDIDKLVKSRTIKMITTNEGNDFMQKRGAAQDCVRVMVVRSWPFHNFKNTGHAAVSIKSGWARSIATKNGNVRSRSNLYFTFWPDFNRKMTKRMKFLGQKYVKVFDTYRRDKGGMVGRMTEARLMSGEGMADQALGIYKKDFDEQQQRRIRLEPLKEARNRQKKADDGRWKVSADKVYLPAFGKTRIKGSIRSRCHMFGLDEEGMRRHAHELNKRAEEGALLYHMKDPRNNCSAKALEMIRVGGLENYIKVDEYLIWSTPNTFHDVAVRLQERIDALNSTVESLHGFASTIPDRPDPGHGSSWVGGKAKPASVVDPLKEKPFNKMTLDETVSYLNSYVNDQMNRASSSVRSSIKTILGKLGDIKKLGGALDKIIPHSIVLVEEMDRLRHLISAGDQLRDVFLPVNRALQHIHDLYNVDPVPTSLL